MDKMRTRGSATKSTMREKKIANTRRYKPWAPLQKIILDDFYNIILLFIGWGWSVFACGNLRSDLIFVIIYDSILEVLISLITKSILTTKLMKTLYTYIDHTLRHLMNMYNECVQFANLPSNFARIFCNLFDKGTLRAGVASGCNLLLC